METRQPPTLLLSGAILGRYTEGAVDMNMRTSWAEVISALAVMGIIAFLLLV
jgi:hypothetical protein